MAARKRIDPSVRPADGRTSYDKVGGKDPGRHYVLTNPNDESTGTDHYVNDLGYEIETVRPSGPITGASRRAKDGAPITAGGQVLVSCSIEDFNARVEEGQQLASALERRIIKDDGLQDGLRGRGWELKVERDRAYQAGEEA